MNLYLPSGQFVQSLHVSSREVTCGGSSPFSDKPTILRILSFDYKAGKHQQLKKGIGLIDTARGLHTPLVTDRK